VLDLLEYSLYFLISSQAAELLIFDAKYTAVQAQQCGLVSEVIPHDRFEAEAWEKVKKISQLPVKVRILVNR